MWKFVSNHISGDIASLLEELLNNQWSSKISWSMLSWENAHPPFLTILWFCWVLAYYVEIREQSYFRWYRLTPRKIVEQSVIIQDQLIEDQAIKEQRSGDQRSGNQRSVDQRSGDQRSVDQRSGDQRSVDQRSGNQRSGDQRSGDQRSKNKTMHIKEQQHTSNKQGC